jgi:hypothetical protein
MYLLCYGKIRESTREREARKAVAAHNVLGTQVLLGRQASINIISCVRLLCFVRLSLVKQAKSRGKICIYAAYLPGHSTLTPSVDEKYAMKREQSFTHPSRILLLLVTSETYLCCDDVAHVRTTRVTILG